MIAVPFCSAEFVICLYSAIHICSPIDGKVFTQAARSDVADIDLACKAAQVAFKTWSKTSVAHRSQLLNKIADVIEANLPLLAAVETVDNGKPIRETMAADLPLVVDHFRYFASVIRAEEGSLAEIDSNTVSLNISEPLGVIGQIIPWNFPLLMAAWKIAPALAAGNTVVVKPAEQTPTGIMILMDLIKDIVPPGVLNVVTGLGEEAGKALSESKAISKLAFTGGTDTGRIVMKAASDNLIPITLELGGTFSLFLEPSLLCESVSHFKSSRHDCDHINNQYLFCVCPPCVITAGICCPS